MKQLPLGLDRPIHKRLTRREASPVYETVRQLRRAGFKVHRAGRHYHLVNGSRLSDPAIIAAAPFLLAQAKQKRLAWSEYG